MIHKTTQPETINLLSDAAQKAYEKIKALILKIFALLKKHKEEKDLKEQFYDSYIDFARKLKAEGHVKECYIYMSICEMYNPLIDKPEELIDNEKFFTELFDEFDELLLVKITRPEEYSKKYGEFRGNLRKRYQYYYTQIATPSRNYDKWTLNKITNCLLGSD